MGNAKRVSQHTLEAFMRLWFVYDALQDENVYTGMEELIKAVPGGKRYYNASKGNIRRLEIGISKVLDPAQAEFFRKNIKATSLSIGVRKPIGERWDQDYGFWLPYATVNQLIGAAQQACVICDKDPQEQRKCPLAKAFDTLPTEKDSNQRGCGYYLL